jgi:hypothetical protein
MIIRKGNIQHQGKTKSISELSEENTNRFTNVLEAFKTELDITDFAFIQIDEQFVYSIGNRTQRKVELNSLSKTLQNEITWLKTLTN